MPLVSAEELDARRGALVRNRTLAALAGRLTRLLRPLEERPFVLPDIKPLLSRDGGVCSDDGARLVFDPLSPHLHRCPRCRASWDGDRHHRAWIWRYQLWLSERAIHFALLHALTGRDGLGSRAAGILDAYVRRYRTYPNDDNVLGPSRLFFSTYLESIWLVQLVVAASLLQAAGRENVPGDIDWPAFAAVVSESSDLIASFNEGWSNRQVWNNAALVAAGQWLGDERRVGAGLDGPYGLRAQLARCVSEEGHWYEGENYHFFALRGFLLAAEFLRPLGIDLYGPDGPAGVLASMFVAPLQTLLPDLTLPARGDAPFDVSVRQVRFAELWEVGWRRTGDPRLATMLGNLYAAPLADAEDTGFVELAEQEQNRPPGRLRREHLGWKALLWMPEEVPPGADTEWDSGSQLLADAGLAVLRPARGRYVSVECGGRPGGHGHPDLLHLTVIWDAAFFQDYGTASYVTPSLHWYRSALAHNAPAARGREPGVRDGACLAFDRVGSWAWCRARARNLFGQGSEAVRSVIVGPEYVVDVVDIAAGDGVVIDLPLHPLAGIDVSSLDRRTSRTRLTDLPAVRDLGVLDGIGNGLPLCGGRHTMHLAPRPGETLHLVEAPGPPSLEFADGAPIAFLVRSTVGPGTWVQCYAGRDAAVQRVEQTRRGIIVRFQSGRRDVIQVQPGRCVVVTDGTMACRLSGRRSVPAAVRTPSAAGDGPVRNIPCPRVPGPVAMVDVDRLMATGAAQELGAAHYRRSEAGYGKRGPFHARVAVFAQGTGLWFVVDVTKLSLQFRAADAPDPALDNEPPDIHSDGVQCYVGLEGWSGFLLVPQADGPTVRVTPAGATAGPASLVQATWSRTAAGYRVLACVDVGRVLRPGEQVPVNVVVNEMYPDRMRRAGQLALVGGGGWVYLRGDRESPAAAVLAEVS